jgi:hypothetical protein
MNNRKRENILPIVKTIAWVLFLLLAVMVNFMADNSFFCFDKEVCNKPYLNKLP